MDIRYSVNQKDFKRYTTEEIRKEFLIENLFKENDVTVTYSHVDRVVTLGAMPIDEQVSIEKNINCYKNFGVHYFLERRELGIINIGGKGEVRCDGKVFKLEQYDSLYVSMGTKEILFTSDEPTEPSKFYMCSSPAHKPCTTKHLTYKDAKRVDLGDVKTANKRTINQYIHPDVLETCQLSMGLTVLEEGNVWNTMPSHTHERRMEVYMYFNVPEEQIVFHYMGEPNETRHIVMKNEQAVISPSWSIHSGGGTAAYSFIWAMAGENKDFNDMDHIKNYDLK